MSGAHKAKYGMVAGREGRNQSACPPYNANACNKNQAPGKEERECLTQQKCKSHQTNNRNHSNAFSMPAICHMSHGWRTMDERRPSAFSHCSRLNNNTTHTKACSLLQGHACCTEATVGFTVTACHKAQPQLSMVQGIPHSHTARSVLSCLPNTPVFSHKVTRNTQGCHNV